PTDDKDLKQNTPTNTDESKSPAKVVLLEYRVSNRKFDDEQEEETLNTCRKYGKVEKCLMEHVVNCKKSASEEKKCVRRFTICICSIDSASLT
ncbi:hypothetical protein MAR_021569, partial [Mya arenaria]